MGTTGQPLVLYEAQDGIASITLNRPEKLNALSRALYTQLDTAMARAEGDTGIRIIIFKGAGRSFCAGADLTDGVLPSGLLERWEIYQSADRRQFRIWESNKLTIAAIHGYCLGRGLELALWCDVAIASEDARLGQPEVRDGSYISSLMPWLIGPHRAKLLMLTGDLIDAREAERIGLIARVVDVGQAATEALRLARRLVHVPSVTAGSIKQAINGIYEHMGLRSTQAAGATTAALIASMTAKEKNIEHLERIRLEQGLKAYLEARDAPFSR